MDWLFRLSLLLTFLPVTESMEKDQSCVIQPDKIWRKTGQSVVLPCSVSSHCSDQKLHYEWFCLFERKPLKLLINSPKYSLQGTALHIKSLHANDSGIYHCAAVSLEEPARGTQHVGLGTTLIVKDQIKVMVRNILLWLSFVLLAIYSLALLTLIIKKYGCTMSICRRMRKTNKKNSTQKTQFRDVLQEMYSRRNLERSKPAVSRNRSQAEAASIEVSTDDVYQNV